MRVGKGRNEVEEDRGEMRVGKGKNELEDRVGTGKKLEDRGGNEGWDGRE